MSEHEIERRLRDLPRQSLPQDADARIVAAIHAARSTPRRRPRRTVPIGIAAGLLIAACAWLLLNHDAPGTSTTGPQANVPLESITIVRLDEPFVQKTNPSSDRLDIGQWQVLALSSRPATERK
ncbi:MAG: hypothetical protein H6816_11875 [Phycisphaerales bacterium]|nr:hypothetical protein [Phycisphaerales bacterium]